MHTDRISNSVNLSNDYALLHSLPLLEGRIIQPPSMFPTFNVWDTEQPIAKKPAVTQQQIRE